MRSSLLISALAVASFAMAQTTVQQPTFTEWHDLQVNSVNRLTPHTSFFAFDSADKALKGDKKTSNRYLSLDGPWRFKWVEHANERPQDFFLPSLDDSQWDTMNMPAMSLNIPVTINGNADANTARQMQQSLLTG